MNKKFIYACTAIIIVGTIIWLAYPKIFPSKPERTILYWTDPMIAGDRSDHPGKSPMGMDRIPVYADSSIPQLSKGIETSYYTCPMHPSVRKDGPGSCPICGMTLVQKTEAVGIRDIDQSSPAKVLISPAKQILANVSTTKATRMKLQVTIHAVGNVEYPEGNIRHISARFPGRIEKLFISFVGQQIHTGDPVAGLYSPDAISAQREYILAVNSFDEVKDQTESIASGARALLDQSKEKLLQWGFSREQIDQLDSTKQEQHIVTIYSPINGTVIQKNVEPQQYVGAGDNLFDVADESTVWIVADVYQNETELIHAGQTMTASIEGYPFKEISGRITFISPTVDPATRTISVRAEFPNPHNALKINMYADVTITTETASSIVIPSSAVLSTGHGKIVWIQKGRNVFEPRAVVTGEQSGGFVQILNGIDENDFVVSSGGYLLDSESQLESPNESSHDQTR